MHPTTCTVVLSWLVDYNSELVKPNEAGCEKLLFLFLTFNTSCRQPLVAWQRLASLAERYSNAISGMPPLVQLLHKGTNECKQKTNQGAFSVAKVRSSVRFCIEIWRVVAIMLHLNLHCLSVPIEYVVRLDPSFPPSQTVWRFELITDEIEV